jgi:hypothetical protein
MRAGDERNEERHFFSNVVSPKSSRIDMVHTTHAPATGDMRARKSQKDDRPSLGPFNEARKTATVTIIFPLVGSSRSAASAKMRASLTL